MALSEEWRDTHDPRYQVSDLGRVRSCARGPWHILKPGVSSSGYLLVCFGRGNSQQVHELVCTAFHGPKPEGNEVLHRDNNKTNAVASNVHWGTRSQNGVQKMRDALAENRYEENLGNVKLTIPEVHAIRLDPRSQDEIAAHYGISQSNVSMIKTRKSWVNV